MFAIPPPSVPPRAPAPVASAPGPLEIESHGYRYAVRGNRLLVAAEVRAALQIAASPTEAVEALRKAYLARGYFLVAVVGRERERDVRVEVVEGRLAHVDGPPALAAFFDDLLGRGDVRHDQVTRRSLLAQSRAATDGRQARFEFVPAAEPGTSTLRITTTPLAHEHALAGSLAVGNLGNRYAGHDLAQAQARLRRRGYTLQAGHARALTGIDQDSRGAFYAASNLSLARVTPAGWFQLDGSNTRYRLGRAFAPLDPGGTVKVAGAGATQLLFADEARRVTLSEGLHRIRDRETVFDGAYALRDQRYHVFDLGSEASWQFAGLGRRTAVFSLSTGAKFGVGGAQGFEEGAGTPTARFRVYTARLGFDQALPGGYGIQLELGGQQSPDTVPSYEQWVLGGLATLTAWLPGTLVGDRGYLGRLAVQSPSWRIGPCHFRASAFAEGGMSRYSRAPAGAPDRQALADVGASLAIDLPGADTHASLAYARPAGSWQVPREARGRQRAHAFVSIQVGF